MANFGRTFGHFPPSPIGQALAGVGRDLGNAGVTAAKIVADDKRADKEEERRRQEKEEDRAYQEELELTKLGGTSNRERQRQATLAAAEEGKQRFSRGLADVFGTSFEAPQFLAEIPELGDSSPFRAEQTLGVEFDDPYGLNAPRDGVSAALTDDREALASAEETLQEATERTSAEGTRRDLGANFAANFETAGGIADALSTPYTTRQQIGHRVEEKRSDELAREDRESALARIKDARAKVIQARVFPDDQTMMSQAQVLNADLNSPEGWEELALYAGNKRADMDRMERANNARIASGVKQEMKDTEREDRLNTQYRGQVEPIIEKLDAAMGANALIAQARAGNASAQGQLKAMAFKLNQSGVMTDKDAAAIAGEGAWDTATKAISSLVNGTQKVLTLQQIEAMAAAMAAIETVQAERKKRVDAYWKNYDPSVNIRIIEMPAGERQTTVTPNSLENL